MRNSIKTRHENISKIKIALIKAPFRANFAPYYYLKIKNNIQTNTLMNKEINIYEILYNILDKTNKINDDYHYNQLNIKLENEQNAKRTKVIKYINDFIEKNVKLNNLEKNKDIIFCEIIYIFDLLLIQNKKYKNLISYEKLGLGALILVLKFNKLHEKNFIKKYKSIFNDRYMTLDEINQIEVLALKRLSYEITQPNHIYITDFLYKNIFMNKKNLYLNIDYIYNQIISIIKYIMTYSNNYIKYHPFFFASYIIKFCLEQNKVDEFQRKFINFFDTNMREFRSSYEEFIKYYKNQIKIAFYKEKNKFELKNKHEINKSFIYYKPSVNNKPKNNNFDNKILHSSLYNGFGLKKEKKLRDKNNNNSSIRTIINAMDNSYYQKYLDNYFGDNSNFNSKNRIYISTNNSLEKYSNNHKRYEINYLDKTNKNILSIESPKKCGISINYRQRKKSQNQANDDTYKQNVKYFNYETYKETKKGKEINTNKNNKGINLSMNYTIDIEKYNKDNNDKKIKIKRLNSEISQHQIYYHERHDSIRKRYKSKKKQKTLINENKNDIEKIKVNTINKINNCNNPLNEQKTTVNNNKVRINLNIQNKYDLNNSNRVKDSSLTSFRGTVNQSNFSFGVNKKYNFDIITKRVRKLNIRQFYKNKNSVLLKL